VITTFIATCLAIHGVAHLEPTPVAAAPTGPSDLDPPVDAAPETAPVDAAPVDDTAPADPAEPEPSEPDTSSTDDAPVAPTTTRTRVAPPPRVNEGVRPAPAPTREPEPAKPKKVRRWPDPLRRGGLVIAGVGVAGCTQAACDPIKASSWLSLAGGYRFGRFAPILQVSGGTTPAKGPAVITVDNVDLDTTASRGSLGFLYVGGGTLLHLLASTNIDPYFGLTLGYFQVRERVRARANDGVNAFEVDHVQATHRGAIGIIVGIGFRIVKRFTLGPRFDFLVPFAGKSCGRDFGTKSGCTDLGQAESDPSEYFPRPWAVTLQAGFVI
jgi:hypothetical protein